MSDNSTDQASFKEIRALLGELPGPDSTAKEGALDRQSNLTKPLGALGRLEELAIWFATWQGSARPKIERPRVAVFAANHGVAKKGVSAFPSEVTAQMVANFKAGGAAVNQICLTHDAELRVYEMALESPTHDFTEQAAMSEEECATAIAYGMMAVEDGLDCLCIGEMGIANSTSGAALAHALYGGEASDWTGPGTGVEGDAMSRKIAAVADGVALHKAAMTDGFEIMRLVGGFELAAIMGAIIAARMAGIPVILDGYAACAAAACLDQMGEGLLDHCIVGHLSAEPAHAALLEKLGKSPVLDYGMRLGEASGAAVALGVLKSAVACHSGMATFAEAGVSGKA